MNALEPNTSQLNTPNASSADSDPRRTQLSLLGVMLLLVVAGGTAGWMAGNDRSGDHLTISKVEPVVQIDSLDTPALWFEVRNASDRDARLIRVDAESGCRTTLSVEGAPALVKAGEIVRLTAKLQLEEHYVHPAYQRESRLPMELLPVVRGPQKKLWVTRQQTNVISTRRSIVASRGKLIFRRYPEPETQTLVLDLFDDITSIGVAVERSREDSEQWVQDKSCFDFTIRCPVESRRVLTITLNPPEDVRLAEYRLSVTGHGPDGPSGRMFLPIKFPADHAPEDSKGPTL